LPVASVHYDDHPNDAAMRDHAYKQGSAVYEAIGATATFPTPPYPSTHNMGTNRMSAKAKDGVVNKFGQTHDIKNLFVSTAASSPAARRAIRRSRSWRWRSGRRITLPAPCSERKSKAFSREVDTGSREENASNQKARF
jgi:GMC oxidoreductase